MPKYEYTDLECSEVLGAIEWHLNAAKRLEKSREDEYEIGRMKFGFGRNRMPHWRDVNGTDFGQVNPLLNAACRYSIDQVDPAVYEEFLASHRYLKKKCEEFIKRTGFTY